MIDEIQWLAHDSRAMPEAFFHRLRQNPPDSPTGDHGKYFAVTGNLFRQILDHARFEFTCMSCRAL